MGWYARPKTSICSSKQREKNVECLRRALSAAYEGARRVEQISTDDLLGDYPAVRYYPPSGDLYFDILTRLREFATFDSIERERKDVEGTVVWVATPAALHHLKKGTVRAKDHRTRPRCGNVFNVKEEP